MNYLAHMLCSNGSPASMLGNFLADFVRGDVEGRFPLKHVRNTVLFAGRIMPILIAAVALSISAGCSVYTVTDIYGIESEQPGVAIRQADAQAGVWIEEDIRFMSIGPPGLPLIPFAVSGLGSDKITIKSKLFLSKERRFSINARPCLLSDSSAKICATMLVVGARAEFPSATMTTTPQEYPKERWLGAIGARLDKEAHKMEPFSREDDLLVDLSEKDVLRRIDTEEVYKYYYYKGEPPWKSLQVTFTFTVPCNGSCPDKFTLDARDFLSLDGERTIDGEYVYVKDHRKQYYFMEL